MKSKIVAVVVITLLLMMLVTVVRAEDSEIINEDEFEARFSENSEVLLANLEANSTVVVPAPDDHECRFAVLWKKVRYENGQPVSGAIVTINSNYDGARCRVGLFRWVRLPVSRTTNAHGSVSFLIYWNAHPPESIVVTITVSKEEHTHTEEVTIEGHRCYYKLNCVYNEIPRFPSVPELELATPAVTSIGAVAYFWFKRRLKTIR